MTSTLRWKSAHREDAMCSAPPFLPKPSSRLREMNTPVVRQRGGKRPQSTAGITSMWIWQYEYRFLI
ncbi:hypothetical protein AB0P36_34770 [Streptomyces flavidovirens]|uniref:hypothetical protein n=1 Tax=Streptomyces flavidovirens TaxID=67298 RepID=UPI0034498E17